LPNNDYFPFDTLEGAAALPNRWKPTPNDPAAPPFLTADEEDGASRQVVVPKVSDVDNPLGRIDLKSALQYGTAEGYPPLRAWLKRFTREVLHPNIPYEGGPDIVLTVGNTDGNAKALEALANVWIEGKDPTEEREGLLVEQFTYNMAIGTARPKGLNIVPVAIDHEGMRPDGEGGLVDVLQNWDPARGKRPHLMYTIT
jgi:DNA-binding transcriptional MocR family regulator